MSYFFLIPFKKTQQQSSKPSSHGQKSLENLDEKNGRDHHPIAGAKNPSGGSGTGYMQGLGQTSASNISSALSSIMSEMKVSNPPHSTNINANINVNVNIATSHITNAKPVPTYSSSSQQQQQKNAYANLGVNPNTYSDYGNVGYANAKSPKNIVPTASSKTNVYKAPVHEEKERPESAYSSSSKRLETDPYAKKFTPTRQVESHTSHVGPSSKYGGPSYQTGLNKAAPSNHGHGHESKPGYSSGAGKGTPDINATKSGGVSSKYGILNLGLNKPGGLYKGSKE